MAQQRLKSGLRKMANAELTFAFLRIVVAQSERTRAVKMQRTSAKFGLPRRTLRRVIDSWLGRGALRRGGKRVAAHVMHVQLSKSWRSWAEDAAAATARRRAALRIANRELFCIFTAWRAATAELISLFGLLLSAASIWHQRLLSSSYRTWRDQVAIGVATRAARLRVLSRIANRALAASFATWHEHHVSRTALRSSFALIRNVAVKWALTAWAETALSMLRKLLVVRQAIGRFVAQRAGRAITKWRDHAQESASYAERSEKCRV